MSVRDERDLRDQLGAALDGFEPGSLPLGVVVRRGRMVMIRKRAAIAACVAVLAAAGAAAPTIAREIGKSGPAAASYHVTVHSPGTGAPRDLIASGRLGKLRWRITGKWQGSAHHQACVGVNGSFSCSGPPDKIRRTGPVTSFDTGIGTQAFIGSVRADVTRLLVSLTNGQLLSLRPVKVFGPGYAGYVGLVLPRAAAVTRITAFAGRREIGYEIPFTRFDAIDTPILLKPGQPPLPRPHAYLIGSGRVRGWHWTEHLYAGPWGSCVGEAAGGWTCLASYPRQLAGQARVRHVFTAFRGNSAGVAVFAVSAAVSYLRVLPPHGGGAVDVRCVNAARARFCVVGAVPDARWVAYALDGYVLDSGGMQ